VTYRYGGKARDIRNRIIPTTAELTVLLSDANQETFAIELSLSNEKRFFLHVKDGNATEFIGMIQVDQSKLDNITYPIPFRIGANDGLSMLKGQDYLEALGKSYIDQAKVGKFKLLSTDSFINNYTTSNNYINIWSGGEDPGGYVTQGKFKKAGTYRFNAHLSLLVESSNNTGLIITTLYRNSEVLAENRAAPQAENARIIHDLSATATLSDTDEVFVQLSILMTGTFKVTLEQTSFFENIIPTAASVRNIYGSVIEHCANLLKQLPTYDEYTGSGEFFSIDIPYTEASQGGQSAEAYIGIPYNAFVKNVASTTIETLDALECLEQIAILCAAQLTYRNGSYHMIPVTGLPQRNTYNRQFSKIGSRSGLFSESPMQILYTSYYDYLPPYKSISSAYTRLRTRNIIAGAAAYFPNEDPLYTWKKEVDWQDELMYLSATFRVRGISLVDPDYNLLNDRPHRHQFGLLVGIGNQNVYVFNEIQGGVEDEVSYSEPELNTGLFMTLVSDPVQTDARKLYDFKINFALPPITYTGEISIRVFYSQTIADDVFDPGKTVFKKFPTFSWDLVKLSLSTFENAADDEDNVYYSETIVSQVQNRLNSYSHNQPLRFSDLWVEDNDPGAVAVLSGSDWVRPGLYDGKALQERLTEQSAVHQDKPVKLFNGTFCVDNLLYGHITYAGDQYILIQGAFQTRSRELSGQWYLRSTNGTYDGPELNTYIKVDDQTSNAHSDGINRLQSSDNADSSVGTPSGVAEYYEEWTGVTADRVQVTVADLPDPAELGAVLVRKRIKLYLNGVKMRYVNNDGVVVPAMRYNQYSILLAGSELVFSEALEAGDEVELYYRE